MMSADLTPSIESRLVLVKRVLRLSLPMAGSRLIQMFSAFIGMLMVAHLGSYALAASALLSSSQIVVIVFAICLFFSVSVSVGEAYGANRKYEIGAIVHQAVWLSFLVTIPFSIATWFTPDALKWFGQSPYLVNHLYGYFHVLTLFMFPILLQTILQQFAYGVLKQRVVIIVNGINMVLFFPYAYFLIFGYGSIHGLGIVGLSWAWGIQDVLNIVMLLWVFYYFEDFKQYGLFKKRCVKGWIYLKQLFRIGWPMSLQFGGELSAMFTRTIFIGWIGVAALGAAQVVQQVIFLLVVPLFAMSEASGILVSQHKGAKEHHMIGRVGNMSLYVALAFCSVLFLIFIFLPHLLASLYLNVDDPANAHMMHLIRLLFLITVFNFTAIVIGDMMSGALRGLFDTRFPMWNSLLFSWIFNIPLSFLFAFTFNWGIVGIFLASSIAFVFRGAGVWLRWRWQLKKIASGSAEI